MSIGKHTQEPPMLGLPVIKPMVGSEEKESVELGGSQSRAME